MGVMSSVIAIASAIATALLRPTLTPASRDGLKLRASPRFARRGGDWGWGMEE